MNFDLDRILESKRALRRDLAQRPVAEKLRMLDAMREREISIRANAKRSESASLPEEDAPRSVKSSLKK